MPLQQEARRMTDESKYARKVSEANAKKKGALKDLPTTKKIAYAERGAVGKSNVSREQKR